MARFRNFGALDDLREAIRLVSAVRTVAPRNVDVARVHVQYRVEAAYYWKNHDDRVLRDRHLSEAQRTADEMRAAFPEDSATYQALACIAAFEKRWEQALAYTFQANQYAKTLFDAGDTPYVALLLNHMTLVRESVDAYLRKANRQKSDGYLRVWATAALDGTDKAIEQYDAWESKPGQNRLCRSYSRISDVQLPRASRRGIAAITHIAGTSFDDDVI